MHVVAQTGSLRDGDDFSEADPSSVFSINRSSNTRRPKQKPGRVWTDIVSIRRRTRKVSRNNEIHVVVITRTFYV